MEAFKILLVDDDEDDVAILADILQKLQPDLQILSAMNGEQALEILAGKPTLVNEICLIVLDLNMPKMNGTQTLTALKNERRFENIPVVIYSTSVNTLEKEKCLLLGAHSYITKPLSHRESVETAAFFLELCKVPRWSPS